MILVNINMYCQDDHQKHILRVCSEGTSNDLFKNLFVEKQ